MEKETLSSGRIVIREKERVNGWSCPPHPFQVVAWFFVVAIPLVYYGTIVSHLPDKWIPAGCIIPGAFLLVHVIFHLICLTVDPADPVIRKKRVEKATEFDRSLHRHVIENFHCYICQVDVGRKSKHCALCNKCISEFDHHCKWLNNCIGGQNYKLFLSCLSAALATALSFLAFCLYPFIMFIIDKTSIMNQREWGMFGELNSVVFITLTSIIVVILVFAILLLGHLLCFHIFLIRKGLSTYDFIIQNRQAAVATSEESQSAARSPNKLKPCKGNKVSQQRTVNEGESGIEITMKDLQRGEIEIDDKL